MNKNYKELPSYKVLEREFAEKKLAASMKMFKLFDRNELSNKMIPLKEAKLYFIIKKGLLEHYILYTSVLGIKVVPDEDQFALNFVLPEDVIKTHKLNENDFDINANTGSTNPLYLADVLIQHVRAFKDIHWSIENVRFLDEFGKEFIPTEISEFKEVIYEKF